MKCWKSSGVVVLSVLVLLALTGTSRPVQAATLVDGGQNRTTIMLEREPSSATQQAADELADYLQQISGAKVPVVREGQQVDTPVTIYVGLDHPKLRQLFPDVDLSMEKFEQLVMAAQGDNLLIAGRDEKHGGTFLEQGTSRAIYTFLEDQLGVRWLWPGELGTVVPHEPTVVVDDFTDRFAPPLQQRHMRLLDYSYNRDNNIEQYQKAARNPIKNVQQVTEQLGESEADWQRRRRADTSWVKAGHAYTRWWDQYHEEHPVYFALQPNGTRDPYPRPSRVKLDISNPAVADQWMEEARGQARNQHRLVISASPNDSEYQGYCVCDQCESWDAKDGPMITLSWEGKKAKHVALTDRYARFWNIVAERLEQEFPDRTLYVGTWAYGAYRTPPMHQKLRDNIIVGYIGGIPVYPQDRREEEKQNWEKWAANASHLLWRPNLFYYDRGMPVAFMQRSAEDMAWLTDHKMLGLDMDTTYGHWSLQGLQYYLISKLAWDPHLDLEAVLDDYMTKAFGPSAASAMRAYFDLQEQAYYRQIEMRGEEGWGGDETIANLPNVYTQQSLDAMQSQLDQARAAVGNGENAETYRKRIDFYQTGLDFTRLQLDAIAAMNVVREADGSHRASAIARAKQAVGKRNDFLNAQIAEPTLNTLWEYTNWTRGNMPKYFGPMDGSFAEFEK